MDSRIKHLMMRRIWKIPLFLLILILIGVTVVTGAVMYSLNIPGRITVDVPAVGDYEIKVYWDSQLTNEVTFIDLGTVKFDTVYNITFYVKNLSNVSCKVGLYTPQATGLRWYQFRPWDFGKFEPDELKEITLIYQVDNSSEGGTFDFDVTFVVYPSE